ncbi:helix-turn-helix domain-containing protein [Thioclava sp.]|uniref:helix-turn-helix domain-containing protein n=1 Tax=Thioclava sp. TaxID=1933450 RepID=UPI0032429241
MRYLDSTYDEHHEYVKYSLKVRGVLLSDIAKELGVSRALVSGALLGRYRSRKVESAVAAHLDTTPENLWPDRDHTDERNKTPRK